MASRGGKGRDVWHRFLWHVTRLLKWRAKSTRMLHPVPMNGTR
jgi:hypothetical protein